jgi:hypothetical protein
MPGQRDRLGRHLPFETFCLQASGLIQDEAAWYRAACGPLAGLSSRFPQRKGLHALFVIWRSFLLVASSQRASARNPVKTSTLSSKAWREIAARGIPQFWT